MPATLECTRKDPNPGENHEPLDLPVPDRNREEGQAGHFNNQHASDQTQRVSLYSFFGIYETQILPGSIPFFLLSLRPKTLGGENFPTFHSLKGAGRTLSIRQVDTSTFLVRALPLV
jgi:hypothetical protein